MSIGYTWGKLSGAVLTLASSDGALQQRLASALLEIQTLQSADFPDEDLWNDYQTILHALPTGAPGGSQGSTHASPAVLRPEEARPLVEILLGLYTEITRLEERHYRTLGGTARTQEDSDPLQAA